MNDKEFIAFMMLHREAQNKLIDYLDLRTKALEIFIKDKLNVTNEEWRDLLAKADITRTIESVSDHNINLINADFDEAFEQYKQSLEGGDNPTDEAKPD